MAPQHTYEGSSTVCGQRLLLNTFEQIFKDLNYIIISSQAKNISHFHKKKLFLFVNLFKYHHRSRRVLKSTNCCFLLASKSQLHN